MERLTKNNKRKLSHGEEIVICKHSENDCNDSCMKIIPCKWYKKAIEKLKRYEDLEEQGRLIKLPIEDKKGDCRECVHTKTQCHHMEYKCSECPLTELFCDEFYLAIDRCYEDAYANGCLAGMDLAKSEAE